MLKDFITKQVPMLFKNKKLLIAISAIIFVPILYAGMFLWAFWDPYDQLEDIPVAIVNQDEGYYYEGEYLTVGSELVNKLKEEAAFDFHFVDYDKGYKGLNNQEYYILIEIPHNFSKNATTVMDDPPEQVELVYVPNESFNFLASQMGETAMLQIEQAIEEKIIETYAETIFDKIDEVADGLGEAEEATETLHDGAEELKDGTKTLNDSLATLASKTIEFKEGTFAASDGAETLSEGAQTIASGVSELYDNSEKLRHASEDLRNGSNQLLDGVREINGGLEVVHQNIPYLVSGTNELYGGLKELHEVLPSEMAKQIKAKVSEGSRAIADGTDQLRTGIVDGLKNKLAPQLSEGLSSGLSDGLSKGIVEKTNQFIHDTPKNASNRISEEIKNQMIYLEQEKIQKLLKTLEEANVPDEVIQTVKQKVENISTDLDVVEQLLQEKIEQSLNIALKDIQLSDNEQKQLATFIESQIEDGIQQGVAEAVDQTVVSINDGFYEYTEAINSNLYAATKNIEAEIKHAIDEPMKQLQDGTMQIKEGQYVLSDGIGQLAAGSNQLESGSEALANGQNDYVMNMNKFTSSFSLAKEGSTELAKGANELNEGMNLLKDGSDQLSDGAGQLKEGSDELYVGMETLVEGTEEFNDEMKKAVDEIDEVETSEQTYQMISNPVKVENEKINEVPNYGTGFSPYFLSLGLFVGALLLSIIYPLREPAIQPKSGMHWFLSKFIGLMTIGVLQALIASGVLLWGLGLEVKSIPLFILYAVITSLTFISLIQFLVTCFDDPGRFMAIIILILQLTTSAGTFPLELIPRALQPINAILPMTYTVAGFKAVVSSGDFSVMWQNAVILIIFTTIFMVGTVFYFITKYNKEYDHIKVGQEVLE